MNSLLGVTAFVTLSLPALARENVKACALENLPTGYAGKSFLEYVVEGSVVYGLTAEQRFNALNSASAPSRVVIDDFNEFYFQEVSATRMVLKETVNLSHSYDGYHQSLSLTDKCVRTHASKYKCMQLCTYTAEWIDNR